MAKMRTEQVVAKTDKYIVPAYGRYPIAFEKGKGSYLYDFDGREYLDFGSGIAVCSLGHANEELAEVAFAQAKKLVHVSNLYNIEEQGELAKKLVELVGEGKVFFANSGGEANEAMFKLARKFGNPDGKFEIITALQSFHGRTLGGISATGQEKVKIGFEPLVPGFNHVPFNDIESLKSAITDKTAAIMIEGIQGEGGILPATEEYLKAVRKICDDRNILFLFDAVQCGFFRSGYFQSYDAILSANNSNLIGSFRPDAISMAKSLGGGFPISAVWVSEKFADILGPGSHGTTYGGLPFVTAISRKVIEIVERDNLVNNVRENGEFLKTELSNIMNQFGDLFTAVRGYGFMQGIEVNSSHEKIKKIIDLDSKQTPANILVKELLKNGLVLIPAGTKVIRFVPALNTHRNDISKCLDIFKNVVDGFLKN